MTIEVTSRPDGSFEVKCGDETLVVHPHLRARIGVLTRSPLTKPHRPRPQPKGPGPKTLVTIGGAGDENKRDAAAAAVELDEFLRSPEPIPKILDLLKAARAGTKKNAPLLVDVNTSVGESYDLGAVYSQLNRYKSVRPIVLRLRSDFVKK